MEAIILAGGRAERLGAAAEGRPKALVRIVGRPLAAYQVALLASAGVDRVIVSCSAGTEELFASELGGLGAEIVTAPEPEPLGRGGGLRFAAALRKEGGEVFALNGDELVDLDLRAMLARHRETGAAATIAVAPLKSPFGVVDLGDGDVVPDSARRPSCRTGSAAASTSSARRPSSGCPSAATTKIRPFRSSPARGACTRFETRASG